MNTKKLFKRLTAVAAGATMLGATVMGAVAADLAEYPSMFVENGVYNGLMVVGENAAAVDNLAMTDIAASMKVSGVGGVSTVSVSGDAWEVKSGSDVLEFGESIGPSSSGVVDFVDADDLGALANGEIINSKGNFEYEQYLHFDDAAVSVTYVEDEDEVTDLFLNIADGASFARYEMDFLEAAESDIEAATYELEDIEGKSLTMLGKAYDVVKAETGGANSAKVTLTLMAGSASATIQEGEALSHTISGASYDVELLFTDSSNRAKFVINGETTNLMDEGDTYTLGDGTVIGLSEVLYQDYAGGIHQAEYFLGADKVELEDDNILDAASSDELSVNEETIDGAEVTIQGTMLTNATATVDGELEFDSIVVNLTAQDDLYVAAGETLLEQAELEEADLIFTQNWDFQFEGMTSVDTDVMSIKDKSGEKEYELTFTNVNGDAIAMPLAYADSAALTLGDQDDLLLLNPTGIADEQFFILNDDSDEDSVTHVVQYKGANVGNEETKLKFKILATGDTLERVYDDNEATLKLSGTTYTVANATLDSADDFDISITGGTTTYANTTLIRESNYLIARGGAKILLTDINNAANASGDILVNVSLIDEDMVDDIVTAPYEVVNLGVSAASSEVGFVNLAGGVSLISPDGNDDHSFGYAANGAFVDYNNPSDSDSAETLTIDWPANSHSVPQVFITSGATAIAASTVGGALTAVAIVDATKLDSEVASADAQNLIVVGGPCVNTVAAELLDNPANCAEGFVPGKSRVKLFEHANGNVAMLVAGYSGADTRLAGKVIAHRWTELSGMEVEIEGTTYSDAVIGAPAPVVVEEVVAEEVVEEVVEE
jgi:hypothetical protein